MKPRNRIAPKNILAYLIDESKMRMENGRIRMGGIEKSGIVEKDGKRYKVDVMAFFGAVGIKIQELKDVN